MQNSTVDLDTLTESEGFVLVRDLCKRFQWTALVTTIGDAESILGRDMTSNEIDRLTDSKMWRDFLIDEWADSLSIVLEMLSIPGWDGVEDE